MNIEREQLSKEEHKSEHVRGSLVVNTPVRMLLSTLCVLFAACSHKWHSVSRTGVLVGSNEVTYCSRFSQDGKTW